MKSTHYAAILAGAYVLLASLYIILSGYLAAGASHSVEELRRIETVKGVLYVAATFPVGVYKALYEELPKYDPAGAIATGHWPSARSSRPRR